LRGLRYRERDGPQFNQIGRLRVHPAQAAFTRPAIAHSLGPSMKGSQDRSALEDAGSI